MLKDNYDILLTAFDHLVFEKLVPADHYLRRLKTAVDFNSLRPLVAQCYSHDMGRGAIDPIRLLKLLLLQFHYGLSDEGVIRQAQVNVAFRFFLDLPIEAALPEPSLLSQFRTRLGAERFQQVFHEIVRQARSAGLVKDRLRLKDATHVLANIAVPTTISLIAQVREQLIGAAECFAPDEAAAHRRRASEIRQHTADLKDEARLLRRVEHLRELAAWGDAWLVRLKASDPPPVSDAQQQAFAGALALAHKVLRDRDPKVGDKLVSLSDTDARSGKHGAYYHGYMLDVSLDADSDLICNLDLLPANADEAASAQSLIEGQEAAPGNDVENRSIPAVAYTGAVCRAISDDETGPRLTVYVPPKEQQPPHPELFQAGAFTLNEAGDELTCPNGATTRARHRDDKDHGWIYQFSIK